MFSSEITIGLYQILRSIVQNVCVYSSVSVEILGGGFEQFSLIFAEEKVLSNKRLLLRKKATYLYEIYNNTLVTD